jgi:hypothetical protein
MSVRLNNNNNKQSDMQHNMIINGTSQLSLQQQQALLQQQQSAAAGGGGGGGGGQSSMPTSTECTRITRRLHIGIHGTLSNFYAEGHTAATWKPLDGRSIKIFGHSHDSGNADLSISTNSLRNAYIVSCCLHERRSTFPIPLGVSLNCIPNNELTETGDRYAFTMLPVSYNTHPQILFEADASQSEGFEWRKMFPEYTDANLDSHNILEVAGCPYVFVHEKHPIIHLLRANHEILGSKIDDHVKIDGEWFKVSKQVLQTCCHTLRTKVLSRISFNDLNTFQLQLKRIDARDWTDTGDALQEHMAQDPTGSILDKPCSFMARIELTYEIPH